MRRYVQTHRPYWWARNVSTEPPPVPAGQTVRFRIQKIRAGKVWFAVKTFDEQSNVSPLSNVVEVELP